MAVVTSCENTLDFYFLVFLQINWGKSAVFESPTLDEITVPSTVTSYTFKYLFSSTSYSFVVYANNDAGRAVQHIEPQSERTYPGTEVGRNEYCSTTSLYITPCYHCIGQR